MRERRGKCKANELVEARETERGEIRRDSEEEADEAAAVKGFFACYLLCSLSPRHKGRTYIGFTVNTQRRIKQHNGEKSCGAWRTKRGRPWEMALCIYGFPSNVSALQFEWAWQHPKESLAVRKAASSFKSLSGTANKIKLAYAMLTLPCWKNLNLTVNFFSTKYMKHIAGCPRLPNQMRAGICSMDDLPCYAEGETLHCSNFDEEEDDGEAAFMDRNMSASGDVTIEQINQNSNQMESSSQFWEPTHYNSESPKPCEEYFGSLTHNLSQNTSFTASSCSEEYNGMEKLEMPTNQSTPRSSSNDITMNASPEFNVIDLCTPSSNIIRSKTKRALFDSEIIDLTDSPMVIRL